MLLRELEVELPRIEAQGDLLSYFREKVHGHVAECATPIRFAVSRTGPTSYHCEVGLFEGADAGTAKSVFEFSQRSGESSGTFNVALIVPTGIGAEIGGHAGDAGPVAQLLAETCDTLITHPNVVNGSDINELPANGLYVEGSILSRLMMGTIGLETVRSNRVIVVIDAHPDPFFRHAAINATNAARAVYGLQCPAIVHLDPPIQMRARYSTSGRAVGRVAGLENLFELLAERRDDYDAVALSSVIDVPHEFHAAYFERKGEMVNPWGGVEAMLTHAISSTFDVPSAHSPMFESQEIANADPGVVDSRMAAEAISLTFLQCVLKGLRRSPRIVVEPTSSHANVLTAANVSCLVIPAGCLGLPTLAALGQGIPVVAVNENRNLMRNDLRSLPWRAGQLWEVENYWEAAGVVAALKAGIAADAVRRPLEAALVEHTRSTEARRGVENTVTNCD